MYIYKLKAHEFRWAHAAAMEACRRQKLRDPKDPGLRESRDHHPWLGPSVAWDFKHQEMADLNTKK